MISQIIRVAALAACAIVALGGAMFVADQVGQASDNTVVAITDEGERRRADSINVPAPDAETEARREREHGGFREIVNDANDVLLAPFSGIVDADNIWVQRGVATILALLVYGAFLLFIARSVGMRKKPHSGQMYDPRRAAKEGR